MNNIAFPSKPDHPRRGYTFFCFCDLDLDLLTLMYKFDLDILKMYLHTRVNILGYDVWNSIRFGLLIVVYHVCLVNEHSRKDTQTCFFDPVTLTSPDDLHIRTWAEYSADRCTCLPKNELSKVRALQINTQAKATENITTLHSQVAIKLKLKLKLIIVKNIF